jgi:hypothetical protein
VAWQQLPQLSAVGDEEGGIDGGVAHA